MSGTGTERFPSFNWMRGVADDKRISVVHRFILIRIVMHREKDGRCNPGYDAIARETGAHRASIFRAVACGIKCGWLAPPTTHGRIATNFVFTFPAQPSHSATVEPSQPSHSATVEATPTVAENHRNRRRKSSQPSQRQRGSPAQSRASTRNGHLTGKENGQQQDAHAREELAEQEVKAKEGADKEERRAREVMDCRTKVAKAFEQAGRLPPDTAYIEVWAAQGYDLMLCASVVAEGLARKRDIGSLKYFDRRLAELHQGRTGNGAGHTETTTKPASAEPKEVKWRRMFDFWVRTETWPSAWGPPPGSWGCGGTDELPPIPTPRLLGWLLEAARLSPHEVHIASAIQRIEERWLPLDDYTAAAAEENAR
jgi:hypothetical protein